MSELLSSLVTCSRQWCSPWYSRSSHICTISYCKPVICAGPGGARGRRGRAGGSPAAWPDTGGWGPSSLCWSCRSRSCWRPVWPPSASPRSVKCSHYSGQYQHFLCQIWICWGPPRCCCYCHSSCSDPQPWWWMWCWPSRYGWAGWWWC